MFKSVEDFFRKHHDDEVLNQKKNPEDALNQNVVPLKEIENEAAGMTGEKIGQPDGAEDDLQEKMERGAAEDGEDGVEEKFDRAA